MEDKSEQGVYVNRNHVGELACTITQIGFDPNNGCEKDANDGPDTVESDGSNFSDNEYETTIITANYDTENFLYTYIYSQEIWMSKICKTLMVLLLVFSE